LYFSQTAIFLLFELLAPFVVFRPLSYVLESPWKKSEEKGALYVARKKSFKELNISSTPLGSRSVISTIIQITFRDRWAIPLVIYNSMQMGNGHEIQSPAEDTLGVYQETQFCSWDRSDRGCTANLYCFRIFDNNTVWCLNKYMCKWDIHQLIPNECHKKMCAVR
jgi:hypothetical protein